MKGFSCLKMTGSGNDFVFVDGRTMPVGLWQPARIRELCRRGTGIGADGFVVLEPGSAAGRVRFHFFNSDGGRAPMCGNGALCATKVADILGIAPSGALVLETDSGDYPAHTVSGAADRATIKLPDVSETQALAIKLGHGERSVHYTRIGVPHLVVLVDHASAVSVRKRGRELRNHESVAPDGANVNFVSSEADTWTMRTFERGVEDETLACGTGAVAAAAVLAVTGQIHLPWTVQTSSGCQLTVDGEPERPAVGLRSPQLTGQARLVFRAQVDS